MALSSDRVIPVANLTEYFKDAVESAMSNQRVGFKTHTTHYVVNLLTSFSRSDALYEQTDSGYGLRPLALMLAEAAEASTLEERNQVLRRLGDVSLFVAGFLSGTLARSLVDVDYYINMGGNAYHSLADNSSGASGQRILANVFLELAEKFQPLVDVLGEVADNGSNNADPLRLYEIWQKTGSERALESLREMGVEPHPAGTKFRH